MIGSGEALPHEAVGSRDRLNDRIVTETDMYACYHVTHMSCGTNESTGANECGEVMAAIDRSGEVSCLVIADVTRDDAWLSVYASEALSLPEWR